MTSYKAMLEWAIQKGHVNGASTGQDTSFLFTLPFTDVGNGERLVTMFGQDLHYSYQMNKWLVWDGTRWNINLTGEVYRKAVATVRAMYAEAGNLETRSAAMDDDEERARMAKIAEALSGWARKSEASSKIESMVRRAESITPIPIMMDQLDVDPWVLNVCNGTLDLQTGELHPHKREDLITKLAPVEYMEGAGFGLWDEFLHRILPDDEQRAFVQRAAGYSITGLSTEEKLFFPFGPTATGKSTLLRAIRQVLGDYAATADFNTFLEKQKGSSGPSNDIARLAGKRFVVSIEVEQGQKLAESLVNSLTGGDVVSARFMYSEFFEFLPSFTLWLAANNRPRVRDDNDANWRRIVQIAFDQQIPITERDDTIKQVLSDVDVAGPAVLWWLLQGCKNWQAEGLAIPQGVRDTTQAYREEMNPLADFLEEACVLKASAQCGNTELWNSYREWGRSSGIKYLLGRKGFTQRLETQPGVEHEKNHNRRWLGIGIIQDID